MKIAHITSVMETVSADTPGEAELYIYYLVSELARRGHQVSLFASADSGPPPGAGSPSLSLVPLEKESLKRFHLTSREQVFYELELIEKLLLRADTVDVIHSHIGYKLLPFADGMIRRPVVSSLFRPFYSDREYRLYTEHPSHTYAYMGLASPEARQRLLNLGMRAFPGVPMADYEPSYSTNDKKYLITSARWPGLSDAVESARRAGVELLVWGVDDEQAERLDMFSAVTPVRATSRKDRQELIAGAAALICGARERMLFPFMALEAMALGTPLLVHRQGPLSGMIFHGQTGFVYAKPGDPAEAIEQLKRLDRRICRQFAELRFDITTNTGPLIELYQRLISQAGSRREESPYHHRYVDRLLRRALTPFSPASRR